MDSAREALGALCRSHPSQELSPLSSELTSIAKRTEAVAQRCAKARGSLQDGLQLHFNGKRHDHTLCGIKLSLFIQSPLFPLCATPPIAWGCFSVPYITRMTKQFINTLSLVITKTTGSTMHHLFAHHCTRNRFLELIILYFPPEHTHLRPPQPTLD